MELEPRCASHFHVRMHVPETGNQELALAVHGLRVSGRSAILSDAGDRLPADRHRALRNNPSVDDIDDVDAGDRQRSRLRRERNGGNERRGNSKQANRGFAINHEALD